MNRCAVTIDVDMEQNADAFKYEFEEIQAILQMYPQIKTTWFVRVDSDIRKRYGEADHVFRKYAAEMEWLRANGHLLGWHVHVYEAGTGRIECRETEIIRELERNIGLASAWGICTCFRMGASVMTNSIMRFLEENGVQYECSGLPRPQYPWVDSAIDWSRTANVWYFPKEEDYQIPQSEHRGIIEIPMSTVPLPASYDSRTDMRRYINPLYCERVFARAIGEIRGDCVVIMHPHEIREHMENRHELLAYSPETLYRNLGMLQQRFMCTDIRGIVR